ncbi:cytoplasmic dynein 2 intermediate chain 2-like [Styela clava]
MFSDDYRPGITIKSSWKSHRKQRENGSQTSEVLTYEVDIQTVEPQDAECQTVPASEILEKSLALGNQNVNETTLVAFLSSVEPMISKQLIKNSTFNVFEEANWGSDFESSDTSMNCEYSLQETTVKNETKNDESTLEVTCLSWSSSGASIAVAYGSMKHMAWGQTRSYLCVWNLDRSRLDQFKCDQKLETESSLQAVAFHTTNPALIAAGLFSGVILLWDISKDEVVYSSESHDDPVTSVSWLQPQSRKYIDLLSASTDGKLITWKQKISQSEKPLTIAKKFQIKASSVRSTTGARGTGSVGITCCAIAVSVKDGIEYTVGDERTLIAGCENGAIVKCVIDENSYEDDPVKFSYKGHLGPVYSVDWSPFHRNVFLTCSTDQRCRFYHALHASPLCEVTPYSGSDQYLYSVKWSPVRALTLFSVGGSGFLTAYDANIQYVINSVESEGENGKKCRINCVEANQKRAQYVATGNVDGIVHVWQLGSKFASPDADENNKLKELAEKAMLDD